MLSLPRPCLDCHQLTLNGSRCESCQAETNRRINEARGRRAHYQGDYRKRAKQIRDTAEICWICGEGAKPGDPWQADHLYPSDPDSPLAAAHRGCNIRRGKLSITETLQKFRAAQSQRDESLPGRA